MPCLTQSTSGKGGIWGLICCCRIAQGGAKSVSTCLPQHPTLFPPPNLCPCCALLRIPSPPLISPPKRMAISSLGRDQHLLQDTLGLLSSASLCTPSLPSLGSQCPISPQRAEASKGWSLCLRFLPHLHGSSPEWSCRTWPTTCWVIGQILVQIPVLPLTAV